MLVAQGLGKLRVVVLEVFPVDALLGHARRAAGVEVGRGDRDVAQRWRLERAEIVEAVRDREPAELGRPRVGQDLDVDLIGFETGDARRRRAVVDGVLRSSVQISPAP